MRLRFNASQSVFLAVPHLPGEGRSSICHYLRQPRRLVGALVDPSRLEVLGADRFRLKMRPLSFLHLSIQPTVDLQVWTETDGTVYLRSVGCEIRGVEYINQRFALDLVGELRPVEDGAQTRLVGEARLEVRVDLPPMLWLTPVPLLEATGTGLLKSVLLTVKQRLSAQLLEDYRRWLQSGVSTPAPHLRPSSLPANG